MTFKTGETLYTATGATVAFDHVSNDMAYVHPILSVTRQVSDGRGDFEEYEDEVLADHLIAVPVSSLTRVKPTQLLDDQIAERQERLRELQRSIQQTEADARAAMRTCERVLAEKQKELEDWTERYPLFAETAAFLEGKPVYALSVGESHYHKHPDLPSIPKDEDLRFIRLRPKQRPHASVRKKGTEDHRLEWVAVTKGLSNDPREQLQLFFGSDAERQEHIRSMFDKVCDGFRAKPKYGDRYSSDITYELLKRWVDRFRFLSIPADIVQMEEDHRADVLERQRAYLQQQLEALEKQA